MIARLMLCLHQPREYVVENVTPAEGALLLVEREREKRRDAQMAYLVQKIAVAEVLNGKPIEHGLFDDPEEEPADTKTLDDATLLSLGFARQEG